MDPTEAPPKAARFTKPRAIQPVKTGQRARQHFSVSTSAPRLDLSYIGERIRQNPDQHLVRGHKTLRCNACSVTLNFSKKSTVDTHIKSDHHVKMVRVANSTKMRETSVYCYLAKAAAEAKRHGSSLSPETMVKRMELTRALLIAGIPMTTVDDDVCGLKPILEQAVGQFNVGALRMLLPDLKRMEFDELKAELHRHNGPISVIFDGTTAVCEVAALIVRWFDLSTGVCQQRALAASMLQQSMTGTQLAAWLMQKLQREFGVDMERVHACIRDGASVNTKAVTLMQELHPHILDIVCSSHSACLAGNKFDTPFAEKFVSLWGTLISLSNIARQLWFVLALCQAKRLSAVRWGTRFLLSCQLHKYWSTVKAVINHNMQFADNLRVQLREFLTPEVEPVLLAELALQVDCGQYVYDFVYKYEGDGFVAPHMYRAKEMMVSGLAAVVVGRTSCPVLTATCAQVAAPAEAADLLAATCAKATAVLDKAESLFHGKLQATFDIYEGLALLVPFNLRVADIGPPTHTLIDKILNIPALAAMPGLREDLINELPRYFVLAENVAADTKLLPWWFEMRRELPTWYNKVLPEAVLMQPTSCTAERLFSMMEWMFREDRQATLEDSRETALMMRYNQMQRQQNAPARLVQLD